MLDIDILKISENFSIIQALKVICNYIQISVVKLNSVLDVSGHFVWISGFGKLKIKLCPLMSSKGIEMHLFISIFLIVSFCYFHFSVRFWMPILLSYSWMNINFLLLNSFNLRFILVKTALYIRYYWR